MNDSTWKPAPVIRPTQRVDAGYTEQHEFELSEDGGFVQLLPLATFQQRWDQYDRHGVKINHVWRDIPVEEKGETK